MAPPFFMDRPLVMVLVIFALVALIRVTAPSDLATGDQPKQADYVHDIVNRASWLVQHESSGAVASKPPLYSWLAAPPMLLFASENEILLKFPSLVAALATLIMFHDLARRTIGISAARCALLFLVLSHLFAKHLYFARTDMLLTCCVVMQLWAVVRFEEDPTARWRWLFRAGGALGLLTKGPVAIAIPLAALIPWWWSRGELRQRTREIGLLVGLLFSSIPLLLWFIGAVASEGAPVWQQLVEAETLDRFRPSSTKSKEHRHILYYVPHLLARMAPWSLLAIVGAMRRGKRDLMIWWVIGPLVMLSLIPSKRADRLLPLLPGICALAGVAFDAWFTSRQRLRFVGTCVWGLLLALAGAGFFVAWRYGTLLAWALGFVIAIATSVAAFLVSRRHSEFLYALGAALLGAIAAYQHVVAPAIR